MKRVYLQELQKMSLYKIKNLDIQIALNQEKKKSDLSAKTMKNIAGFVSASIGLYREDFRFKVTLPEKERYDYYLPTQDDITALLAYTEGKELHTAIYWLLVLDSAEAKSAPSNGVISTGSEKK